MDSLLYWLYPHMILHVLPGPKALEEARGDQLHVASNLRDTRRVGVASISTWWDSIWMWVKIEDH